MASGLMLILGNFFSTRICIANWTREIASVCYFYQGETTMLFMIGAESTIIGTAIFNWSIKFKWHVPWLDEFQGLLVIFNIIGNQHFLMSVGGTVLD